MDPAFLRSDHYIAFGCDLTDMKKLNAVLANECNFETCSVLFVAEVSMTYMDEAAADSLVKWACQFNDGMFNEIYRILHHSILLIN